MEPRKNFLRGADAVEEGGRPHSGRRQRKAHRVPKVDIRGFFDAIDRAWLVQFVKHRIADRRILRLIQKWLNAGVLEEDKWMRTGVGTNAAPYRPPAASGPQLSSLRPSRKL